MIAKTLGLTLLISAATAAPNLAKIQANPQIVGADMTDIQKDALYAVYMDQTRTPKRPGKIDPQMWGRLNLPAFAELLQEKGVKPYKSFTCIEELCGCGNQLAKDYCKYYTSPGADVGGWTGLTFYQFLAAVDAANEFDGDAIDKITKDKIGMYQVHQIVYKNINHFESTGGNSGTQTETVKYDTGRSSTSEISTSTMNSIAVDVSFEIGPVGGDAGYENQVNFSQALAKSTDSSSHNEQTVVYDLSVPNYAYQQQIEIVYKSGQRENIKGALFISDKPLTYSQTVTYNDDGTVKDKQVSKF